MPNPPHQDAGQWFEFRCKQCDKLLGKQDPLSASLEIKCLRCGSINSLLEDANKQIFMTDSGGKIIYVNDQVEKITGYSPQEVMGKTPALWGRQMPKAFYRRLWQTILKEKRAAVIRLTNRRKDGKTYPALTRISPILNDRGQVQYFLAIQTPLLQQSQKSRHVRNKVLKNPAKKIK